MRSFINALPWVLVIFLIFFLFRRDVISDKASDSRISHTTILSEVEALGKLELVRYNFKDITELEKQSKEYFFKIIKFGPDSKIALISVGSAVGCMDLTRITPEDIRVEDTVYIRLPEPELCNYQLDMKQTHIYALETNPMINEKAFIQEAYRLAEERIRESALNSGILEQTKTNAQLVLAPILEKLTGAPVVFVHRPKEVVPEHKRNQ